MSTKDDGGPAFPELRPVGDMTISEGGMTLRDWFAGQALVGLLASADAGNSPNDLARACGAIADAMIAERAKQ